MSVQWLRVSSDSLRAALFRIELDIGTSLNSSLSPIGIGIVAFNKSNFDLVTL